MEFISMGLHPFKPNDKDSNRFEILLIDGINTEYYWQACFPDFYEDNIPFNQGPFRSEKEAIDDARNKGG